MIQGLAIWPLIWGGAGLALFGPHINAERTAIERERFKAIEVKNLAELDEATVWQRVERFF